MICFCAESAFLSEFAYFDCMIILLTLIAVNNQTVLMKHFYIVKHFLQNEFLLNENICLLRNHHIYDQNVYFDIISCAFLTVLNMQYFHHSANSEILHVNFCYYYFLIELINCISDHMLDHDHEISSDNTSF